MRNLKIKPRTGLILLVTAAIGTALMALAQRQGIVLKRRDGRAVIAWMPTPILETPSPKGHA